MKDKERVHLNNESEQKTRRILFCIHCNKEQIHDSRQLLLRCNTCMKCHTCGNERYHKCEKCIKYEAATDPKKGRYLIEPDMATLIRIMSLGGSNE